ELEGRMGDKEGKYGTVSDGKKLKGTDFPSGKEREQPLSSSFGADLRTGLSRFGLLGGLTLIKALEKLRKVDDKWSDVKKVLRVSDFKFGKGTQIDGRAARVLKYKVSGPATDPPVAVTLWLDPSTGLPIKREVGVEAESQSSRVVETYSEFKLAAKG